MSNTCHISRTDLELLHLGAAPEQIGRHVESCEACSQVLSLLRARRTALLARHSPTAYVARLRAEQRRQQRRELAQRLAGSVALAAAVGSLMIRSGETLEAAAPRPGSFIEQRLSHAARPRALDDVGSMRAKGDTSLAVVVKRRGAIHIVQDDATLIPGDEIRVRFFLPEPATIRAGVLTDEGGWEPLFEGRFDAGLHTPPATLRVTDTPLGGIVLLGAPADIDAALAGLDASVTRARLLWTADEHETSQTR